jgi:uncharacterized protein YkwD
VTLRRDIPFLLLCTSLLGALGCPSAAPDNSGVTPGPSIESSLGLTQQDVLSSTPAPICAQAGVPADTIRQQMFEALNNYRAANGLRPLIYSKRLEAAADAHVADLATRAFFDHINPDGEDPGDRAREAGFCHEYVGENIAAGQTSVAAVQIAWQNSPSHNENMLEPDYRYVGMGHYVDSNGRQYWAQEFAFELP